MKRRWLTLALGACVLSGCAGGGNSWLSGTGEREASEEADESWDFVGEEGRAGQAVERDPDQWFRKYFMSEKHREIERNLGFE